MDKKVVLYWGGKFQASHIVRFTLTLCHQLWTISSIQWKNSQALNSPLTVLVKNNIRKPLYLIICLLHLFMLIIWTLRMHHWPCLMRNQVRYDISSYMYKNTFTLSKMFFNRPLYLVRFKQMSKDLKDKDFTENLYCTKILNDTVVKLREAFRVTSENLKMSTFPIINLSKKNILVPLSVSE